MSEGGKGKKKKKKEGGVGRWCGKARRQLLYVCSRMDIIAV